MHNYTFTLFKNNLTSPQHDFPLGRHRLPTFVSDWPKPPSCFTNVPGESTLRRDFLRLQQENKERSEALKRQQAQLAAQRRDPEEHKRQLLHDRQKRIEEQKEQRRRLEEVGGVPSSLTAVTVT